MAYGRWFDVVMSSTITSEPGKINLSVRVKKWAWPIFVFKAMKSGKYKWYNWLKYPWLCIKIMRKGLNG